MNKKEARGRVLLRALSDEHSLCGVGRIGSVAYLAHTMSHRAGGGRQVAQELDDHALVIELFRIDPLDHAAEQRFVPHARECAHLARQEVPLAAFEVVAEAAEIGYLQDVEMHDRVESLERNPLLVPEMSEGLFDGAKRSAEVGSGHVGLLGLVVGDARCDHAHELPEEQDLLRLFFLTESGDPVLGDVDG